MPVHVRAEDGSIPLHHVGDGVYEADFENTGTEGVYGFGFEAEGLTEAGHAFSRGYSVSRALAPVVDPVLTGVQWIELHPERWQAVVRPVQPSGNPVGPGQKYTVLLDDRKPLPMTSRMDGSYVVDVPVDPKRGLPTLTLATPDGRKAKLPGLAPSTCGHRVRVTLEAIELTDLDDRKGSDELHFAAMVAPDGDRRRATIRRLPIRGAKVGERAELNEVLFDGVLADAGWLAIAFAGTEVDLRSYLAERGKKGGKTLARYVRRLRGPVPSWAGRYEPRDERPDPEELEDWRVWYRVEVI
jgi:hypothetical protein